MKLATWNVNSLNVRLGQVLGWLQSSPVDVLCLQETKLVDERFPADAIAEAGYRSVFAGQPAYNGVAILWRADRGWDAADVVVGNPLFPDEQKRLISATLGGLRVISAYVPNGQAVGSDKYEYKLRWLDSLSAWLGDTLAAHPRLVVAGDWNIAPDDRDVHDPVAWAGQVLCSEPERDRFRRLLDLGLHDAFRLLEQPPKTFSWWDYRQLGFQKNRGLRIDHLLVSAPLAGTVRACAVDRAPRKLPQPSDHAPVVLEIDD
ncbi:MAG TPA: exodeoxyribonuclease III [Burkholderiaceae bacterium]|nr:exodeoxyribonuclease III [Burkholderiaceae bacterium]